MRQIPRLCKVGATGTILISPNGINWTSRTGTSQDLYGIAYSSSQNLWVAVGDNGTIITSSNGTTGWTIQTSGTSEILNGVASSG